MKCENDQKGFNRLIKYSTNVCVYKCLCEYVTKVCDSLCTSFILTKIIHWMLGITENFQVYESGNYLWKMNVAFNSNNNFSYQPEMQMDMCIKTQRNIQISKKFSPIFIVSPVCVKFVSRAQIQIQITHDPFIVLMGLMKAYQTNAFNLKLIIQMKTFNRNSFSTD